MSSKTSNLKGVHGNSLTRRSCTSWKLMKEAKEKYRGIKLMKRRMEIKNMKLYLMNRIMVEENEKLRRKAMALLHENRNLISQFMNICNNNPQ